MVFRFSCLFLVHIWWSSDGLINHVEDGMTMPESIEYTRSQSLITGFIHQLLIQVLTSSPWSGLQERRLLRTGGAR